jgi:uncharacterized protein (DUF1501 family)
MAQRKNSSHPPLKRRDFLQIGAMGATGLALPTLLRNRVLGAGSANFVNDKSVIFLFLAGGPSQYETFDPKQSAPAEIRGVTGEVQTNLTGVNYAGVFPQLAKHADKLAVIRSFKPEGSGIHEAETIRMLTGGTVEPRDNKMVGPGGSIGSLHARIRGMNHPRTGTPTYAYLQSPEIDEFYINFFLSCSQQGSASGGLGTAYAPFTPGRGGTAIDNMNPRIPAERLSDRRSLLASLDRFKRDVDQSGEMDGLEHFRQQAFDVVNGGAVRKALDLEQENARVVERYDTSHLQVHAHQKKKNGESTLGKMLLTARRLCEAGCGFVTVASGGWDMHGDGNNPGVLRGSESVARPLDHAVSAFLDDVHERGLSEKILIVITGEFGRSPKLNNNGGRNHWGGITPLVLAGGGLKMGQVVGQSSRDGSVAATEPIRIRDLMATITHTVFDVGKMRLQASLPPEILRLTENGRPIEQLF